MIDIQGGTKVTTSNALQSARAGAQTQAQPHQGLRQRSLAPKLSLLNDLLSN